MPTLAGEVAAGVAIKEELHEAFGLTPDQTVSGVMALNRVHSNRAGQRIPGGALIVRCEVAGPDIDPERRYELEINDEQRPLSDAAIALLGLQAQAAYQEGRFIDRIVLLEGDS